MSSDRIDWQSEPKIPKRSSPDYGETGLTEGIGIDMFRLIHSTEKHPVTKMPLANYIGKLNEDCWTDENGNRLTPRSLVEIIKEQGYENAEKKYPHYLQHIRSIQSADYSFPVHVYRGHVINGAHRIAKLIIERDTGNTTQDFLTVKDLKEIPREAIIHPGSN